MTTGNLLVDSKSFQLRSKMGDFKAAPGDESGEINPVSRAIRSVQYV
jgi:hypothetical protein